MNTANMYSVTITNNTTNEVYTMAYVRSGGFYATRQHVQQFVVPKTCTLTYFTCLTSGQCG
jgi:hypothetical protein